LTQNHKQAAPNLRSRFQPVFDSFVSVVRAQFEECIDPTDFPPMYRLELTYVSFMENVNALKPKMLGEIEAAMDELLRAAEEIGLGTAIRQLISDRIEVFQSNLTAQGLQEYVGMVDRVKGADQTWRSRHPAMAARFRAGGEYECEFGVPPWCKPLRGID
jgi:hypothetical protein